MFVRKMSNSNPENVEWHHDNQWVKLYLPNKYEIIRYDSYLSKDEIRVNDPNYNLYFITSP